MNYTNEDIKFLQELTEDELCELVILPLLEALEYKEIRYLHGNLELGKDIVCKKYDNIEGDIYNGFVVKSKKVTGDVSSNRSLREIFFQISQAYSEPFIYPYNGKNIFLQKVHFTTPFEISQNAILSLRKELKSATNNISFIDGVKLLNLIKKHTPDLLESLPNPEIRYTNTLYQVLKKSFNNTIRSY